MVITKRLRCWDTRICTGRRIQSSDDTDQWRDQFNAATVCPLSDISESSVATHFRCGGIFSDGII